jgi:predicted phosphodiesterase
VTVAALYDVHGNLPALAAVLEDARFRAADVVVCGGDLVAGPMPAQCLDRLAALGERVRFLRGNGDREVATAARERGNDGGLLSWCAEQLGHARLERVREWPLTVELEIGGLGTAVFCHAVPRDDMPILTTLTPDADVEDELNGVAADVVVCGHVHVQYDRRLGNGLRLVNAGSVGRPYEGHTAAFWALVGPGVCFVSTPYDVEAAVAAVESTAYPESAAFVEHLREPVPAADAMSQFEAMRGA